MCVLGGGEKLGQGKEGAREFLKKNKKITEEIKAKILAKVASDKKAAEDASSS